jgi:hypothetical protein
LRRRAKKAEVEKENRKKQREEGEMPRTQKEKKMGRCKGEKVCKR